LRSGVALAVDTNKLLKSLILTQQQDRKRLNDMDETDVAKKVKYESNNDSLKKKCRLE